MYRSALLMTTALVALSASSLLAALQAAELPRSGVLQTPKAENARILYSQNSNYSGIALGSMNLTSSGSAYNDQAADDFVIPTGRSWTITEIDVSGVYYNGYGPATSENVIFYKNAKGLPGKAVAKGTFNELHGADDDGNFAIALPKGGLRLKSGHYWVSVIANIDFVEYGLWGWDISSTVHEDQAAWRNPGGGFEFCRNWGTLQNCVGMAGDMMFRLRGETR